MFVNSLLRLAESRLNGTVENSLSATKRMTTLESTSPCFLDPYLPDRTESP